MRDDRPHGLEYKAVTMMANSAPARRRNAVRTTAVIGPTGVAHGGDLIEANALVASVRARAPRVAVAHDWRRPVGDVVGAVALPAGDPRLPRTTADGQPWPAAGGGCLLHVELMPETTQDARLAVKAARTVGPGSAWSFGFKVVDGRTSGGLRRVSALSVFTVCPPATGTESKGATRPADIEVKGADGGASVAQTLRKRWALRCGLCDDYVALADKPLPPTASIICADCVEDADRLTDPFDRMVSESDAEPIDGDRPERVTAEGAYAGALDDETEYEMDADGTLNRATAGRRWGS